MGKKATKRNAGAKGKAKAQSSKPTPAWQVVENVVAAIERVRAEIPGVEVRQKVQMPVAADPTRTRDVDVLVTVPVQGRLLTIGIEVKAKGRPVTVDELGCIVDIRNEVRLDRFCVVSTSGFSGDAERKAKQEGLQLETLREFANSSFWAKPCGELLFATGVEVVGATFEFSPDVLIEHERTIARILHGVEAREMRIEKASGKQPLHLFVEHHGREAIPLFQEKLGRELSDGQIVRLRITLPDPTTRLFVRDAELPKAEAIDAVYRFRRWRLQERRFQLLGIDITTCESMMNGQLVQTTLLAVPREDDPAARQIYLSVGPAQPRRTRSERLARTFRPTRRDGD